jgi:hypothetical protein
MTGFTGFQENAAKLINCQKQPKGWTPNFGVHTLVCLLLT